MSVCISLLLSYLYIILTIFNCDVGASSLIADGLIKLKAESEIESFTQHGLKFKDGTEIQTDVVVFATGYGLFLTEIK